MQSAITASRPRIGLLSTFPPRLCGLATFAAALVTELRGSKCRVDVVNIDDGEEPVELGPVVAGTLVNGMSTSVRNAARVLSRCDVAIIQHEYGIYGGVDGDEVVDLLAQLDVPAIVILHTVPAVPTPHQKVVLEAVCRAADRVVVMTEAARDQLTTVYSIGDTIVLTIPHGATAPATSPRDGISNSSIGRPQLLTWGLLGPGKGIEHVIDALGLLGDARTRPKYTVAGVTHPKVFARDGDAYRQSLMRRSWATGVVGSISFDDTYRDVAELARFAASASVVVLPYDSRVQVTSGVLVDAIAAGRPVIATAFPHAVEILASGAGIVVPHADPLSLARAIESTIADPSALESMAAEARRIAPSLHWRAVAGRYVELCDELVMADEAVAIRAPPRRCRSTTSL